MVGVLESRDAWMRRFHPAPRAASRLICFPHAGGSSTYYFPVSRALAPDVDVVGVQYPGRQDRRTEPCVDDLRRLADLITPHVLPLVDRPTLLFGHSMGATLAYEVGLRLAEEGVSPHTLVVTGRRAPSTHREEWVHRHSDADLIADVMRLDGTSPEMFEDKQVVSMILPALRADYRAAETYRYRHSAPLGCPIVALIGDEDPHVTLDEARAWAAHTSADFSLGVYPGGHFFLVDHAPAVLGVLRDRIAGRPLTLPAPR